MSRNALLVEDDGAIATVITAALVEDGFSVGHELLTCLLLPCLEVVAAVDRRLLIREVTFDYD